MDITPFCVSNSSQDLWFKLRYEPSLFFVFIEDSFQNNYGFFIVLYDCIV